MLAKIKQGLYSDTKIVFNGKIIYSHNEYLRCISYYFGTNICNHHEITFLDINGKILNSELFAKIINMLYDDVLSLESFGVLELIEIYRLWDYFGFEPPSTKIKVCLDSIRKEICKKINTYEGLVINLNCNNHSIIYNKRNNELEITFMKKSSQKRTQFKSKFKLSDIKLCDSEKYPKYKYFIEGCMQVNNNNKVFKSNIFFDSSGKIYYCIKDRRLVFDASIDIDYIIENKKMNDKYYTFEQSFFLLDLFIDDEKCNHKKIISEMEILVENISKYPKKFHKLICKQFSENIDDLEVFNINNEEDEENVLSVD